MSPKADVCELTQRLHCFCCAHCFTYGLTTILTATGVFFITVVPYLKNVFFYAFSLFFLLIKQCQFFQCFPHSLHSLTSNPSLSFCLDFSKTDLNPPWPVKPSAEQCKINFCILLTLVIKLQMTLFTWKFFLFFKKVILWRWKQVSATWFQKKKIIKELNQSSVNDDQESAFSRNAFNKPQKKKNQPCMITRHMFPVLKGNTEAQIARNAAC